ncbi:DNA-directed RNA polymerases I, II, and III subunit RPABC3 [Dimargaris verticillata]|uniref:DNA-directed RNA polymerases I, II, and III subunit RPABC3 n=1 Tax=Dimargaris verticillata TaxID=2761393 RepID=A0A9W8EFQ1_9FUNG|nr:DNA-directed RNA polymerases I, II, and III subunit RPABC3 [Dimargaris verticillata]
MSNQDAILFTDIFDCKDIDRDGKKFDRVSRLSARSENYDMGLLLDYNVELYPMKIGDKFSLVLASTLSLSGQDAARSQTGKQDTWRPNVTEKTLADDYDYVMYGKIYRYDDSASSRV